MSYIDQLFPCTDPKNNMKAAEDFFELVLVGHFTAATEIMNNGQQGTMILSGVADTLVNMFVHILSSPKQTNYDVYL